MTVPLAGDLSEDKAEWIESIDYIGEAFGDDGVREILRTLWDYALDSGIPLHEGSLNTPYVNTIPPSDEPDYPGDIELEGRIENLVRWNAVAMVLRAQDEGEGVGGHIATYASAARMLEVGFNHFFRRGRQGGAGDVVMPQPHAAPGIYARAFLEGRLTECHLHNFRRELGEGGGLSSYPHPRSMPEFWQMPNASMGLSVPAAIYQARFAKYLRHRGLIPDDGGKFWCFIGDGEADEPEVLGTIGMAARERLDNVVLVVNCNLQRLDGPVRGNGKVIQELERAFRGASWNVIKVIWGSGWDGLLARDHDGVLRRRMEECLDGDYQRYSILPGNLQREHWVEGNPQLERLMQSLSDEEVRSIRRGGQDSKKIHAAFDRAARSTGGPTVILVKTVKGDGVGEAVQGRNTAHQKKNMTGDERLRLAREYGIPLSDQEARNAGFYRPPEDSAELRYLRKRREALGGYLPERTVTARPLEPPPMKLFAEVLQGSGERKISTTMALVRILTKLLKDDELGRFVVPIVPDEARTFGMEALFRVAGIYSAEGQKYRPVDADSLLPYREAIDGQILQEGICETGAMASFMAAGSAYAMHGVPMIPFYTFYSMFGFQRVGDMIWSCGDMLCRGFLIGGTAGRTTLNGEGLQHQDGHSHVLGATVPNLVSYDPAFGYEIAVIIRDGIRRMYRECEDVFYYLTVYNENYPMPALPNARHVVEGILRGGYCLSRSRSTTGVTVNLLSSGAILQQAVAAAERLGELGYRANVWSITSFTELQRDAQECERANRATPGAPPKKPYISRLLENEEGLFIAVTDYIKALPAGISRWIPGHYEVLGTDGYGRSESRGKLRDYFEVSARYVAYAAVAAAHRTGNIDGDRLAQHRKALGL